MALLNILQFPDPRLKNKAEPVIQFDEELSILVENMFETMYEMKWAVGLAAIQVNVKKQVIVIDVSENRDQPLCLINPKILSQRDSTEYEEGCLSFPGVYAKVKRFKEIDISYFDKEGTPQQLSTGDFLSICIQHEIDHLNGITFYDHLAPVKQHMLRKKLEKTRRKAKDEQKELG